MPSILRTTTPSIFYVTDRAPVGAGIELAYGAERSNPIVFGTSTVVYGENLDWTSLSALSGELKCKKNIPSLVNIGVNFWNMS